MNTFFESIINHSMTNLIGMVLVHFLWQATLVAIAFAAIGNLQRRCSSQTRYATSLLGLLIMVTLPLVTFAILSQNLEPGKSTVSDLAAPELPRQLTGETPPLETGAANAFAEKIVSESVEKTNSEVSVSSGPAWLSAARSKAILPWLVGLWCGGVVVLAIRLMLGFNRIRSWRRSATAISSLQLIAMRDQLCQRMEIKKSVRLLESIHNTSPIVIGWVRPAILIPASVVSGLTAREMEAILVHELAHIGRHDYLVNMIQAIIETVLFYHPAVWWLSNRVREEREHCCDDVAIEVCGDRKTFVHALAKLEEIRCRDLQVAVAASGGSPINRMKRILNRQPPRSQSAWPAGMVTLVSVVCLVAALIVSGGKSEAFANQQGITSELAVDDEQETQQDKTGKDSQQSLEDANQQLANLIHEPTKNVTTWRVRKDQPGVTVLSTRTYEYQRTATQSVELKTGQQLEVDEAIVHEGKKIYLALSGEVVAIDAATGTGQWLIPQTKIRPLLPNNRPPPLVQWTAVSVVDLELNGKAQTAIELFAPRVNTWKPTYLYYEFETGKLINFATPDDDNEGWGPAPEQSNLRLRLTLKESEVKEGEPVLASLEIKNFGDTAASYDPQYFGERILKVTHVSGELDYYLASPVGSAGGPIFLQPGRSEVLWKNFDVGSLCLLDKGEYQIQAANSFKRGSKTMPASKILTLSISEGQHTPLKRFIKSLIAVAPDGWRVEHNGYGIGVSLPAVLAAEREKKNPELVDPDLPKKVKPDIFEKSGADAPGISLRYASVQEIRYNREGQPKPERVEVFIKTELGYLIFSANAKAKRHWPDHFEKICEACKSIQE